MDITKAIQAKDTAARWHDEVQQKYNGTLPYSFHSDLVQRIAYKYITLVPENKRVIVLSAAALHDVIEDCRKTYNDVEMQFGREIAEIVYALTNEKGRSRKDRANHHYYKGLRETKYATFVKLCDRIANVLGGYLLGGKMLKLYQKEQEDFKAQLAGSLDDKIVVDLVYDLEVLLKTGIFNFTNLDEVRDVTD